jgi:anti-sigma B factor antagonist
MVFAKSLDKNGLCKSHGRSLNTSLECCFSHVIIYLRYGNSNILWRTLMEITTKDFKHCVLLNLKGRVDSSTAPQLSKTMEKINEAGTYKIVVDMSGLEYMSSAGFRALLATQRNCKRYNRGEVVLAVVPARIHEALELAGFTELFKTFDDSLTAVGQF